MTAFEEMGVVSEIAAAVDEMDWTLPMDIQAEAIPAILGGGDVAMAAETGSGKTGAFCLPVLQIVWEAKTCSGESGKKSTGQRQSTPWMLNMYDRGDALAIDPAGLLCQSRDPQKWQGGRTNKGLISKGKYYFEATVQDDGLCRVGWSTLDASLDLGTDRRGFGFGGTGKKSFGKQFDAYGESFGRTDIIGCFLDLDSGSIAFSKNGKMFEKAFDVPQQLNNQALFPALVLKNAEILLNFGFEEFSFPPKNGYVAVCEAPKDCVVASSVHGGASTVKVSESSRKAPMCLIIEPSRELADQTFSQIEKFKKYLKPVVRNLVVVGGVPAREQLQVLQAGVDIVTGTPGRLEEFVSSGDLDLSQIRFFILDEADGLLSAGYTQMIDNFYARIPKVTADGKRLQMVICSATLHNFDVKKLASRLMHFPQWLDLKGQDTVPETVHHVVVMVDPKADKRWMSSRKTILTDGIHVNDDLRPGSSPTKETLSEAVKRLKGDYVLQAIQQHNMDQAIIFCRTKLDCDNLERWLKSAGHSCVCLHGDRRPPERKQNLQNFKDFKVKFLVCTDVAARGIDIKGVPYVINVTMPDEKANYLHRIGRVGRADRMGLAVSLVATVPEKVWYHGCPSRGKSCNNTRLTDQGGCAIWYKEPELLAEVEDHLGVTIQQVDADVKIKADEFDGKVVYGAKRRETGTGYQGHASMLAATVQELAELEKAAQTSYLKLKQGKFAK